MSTLRVTTLQNLSGTEVYTAKAWVNFNGTGTVAIRASGNVSSITDNSTGDYTINFTTAMPDANWAVTATAQQAGAVAIVLGPRETPVSTAARVLISNNVGTAIDSTYVNAAIFR
jgi:hypothetical protein